MMARIAVEGLVSLMADLEALIAMPDSVAEAILDAEADVVVTAQRSEIASRWKGPYSMGISAKSVKKGKVKKTKDGHAVHVSPQGARRRGKQSVRNAEIAFINEYGARDRGIAPRPAIGTANAKAEKQTVESGERVLNAYLDSKNL